MNPQIQNATNKSILHQLQNPNDPNLSFCPPDYPIIPFSALEAEGTKLIESVLTIFYTSTYADSAALLTWLC